MMQLFLVRDSYQTFHSTDRFSNEQQILKLNPGTTSQSTFDNSTCLRSHEQIVFLENFLLGQFSVLVDVGLEDQMFRLGFAEIPKENHMYFQHVSERTHVSLQYRENHVQYLHEKQRVLSTLFRAENYI